MEDPPSQDSEHKAIAVVEYDYAAKEDDEIDLRKGQIIQNIVHKPGGWWEGTISSTGKRGMFPDNFVRLIENLETNNSTVVLREKSCAVQRRCKAIYSYTQVNEDELSLAVGDVIEILAEVEEGWWSGKLNNKVGVFPSNFVVSIPNSPMSVSKRPQMLNENKEATKSISEKTPSSSINKNRYESEKKAMSNNREDTTTLNEKPVDDYRAPELPPRPIREFCIVEFPYSPQNDDELELATGEIITILDKELPDKGWWKGEVNGKIGVFPDNFVKHLPVDVELEKSFAMEFSIKGINSTIGPLSPPKGFESKFPPEGLSKPKGNVVTQRIPLECINADNIPPQPTSSDRTNKNIGSKTEGKIKAIENFDKSKVPPPLPTKKPIIPGKKSTSAVDGNIISGLRQKVKNVEQKSTVSRDGSKLNLNNTVEPQRNIEKTNSVNDLLGGGENEFDKVQRASILSDMRAGRIKAPKRRPPSIATNLMTESTIIKTSNFNNETKTNNDEEEIKPKSLETKKVPWVDELKASQIKLKSYPYIEPRTTLVNVNNIIKPEETTSSNISAITNVSAKKTNADGDISVSVSLSKERAVANSSSTSFYQSQSQSLSTETNNIESETKISKPVPDTNINKIFVKDKLEEIKTETSLSRNLKSKFSNERTKTEEVVQSTSTTTTNVLPLAQCNEAVDSVFPGEKNNAEQLEKRVGMLEATVQIQQNLIEDLQRMLQNESNRIELLKNQLDKYAQCVTQV